MSPHWISKRWVQLTSPRLPEPSFPQRSYLAYLSWSANHTRIRSRRRTKRTLSMKTKRECQSSIASFRKTRHTTSSRRIKTYSICSQPVKSSKPRKRHWSFQNFRRRRTLICQDYHCLKGYRRQPRIPLAVLRLAMTSSAFRRYRPHTFRLKTRPHQLTHLFSISMKHWFITWMVTITVAKTPMFQ